MLDTVSYNEKLEVKNFEVVSSKIFKEVGYCTGGELSDDLALVALKEIKTKGAYN